MAKKEKKVLKFGGERVVMDLNELIPYEYNNKDHPDAQVNVLANIIDKRGYTDEILVDKNNIIIAGHGRLESIKKMGYDAVEVKKLDIDSKDARAMRLLHNKVAELATTNIENVHIELKELQDFTIGDIQMNAIYTELHIPEYNPNDYAPVETATGGTGDVKKAHIIVEVDSKSEADELADRLRDEGYSVTVK